MKRYLVPIAVLVACTADPFKPPDTPIDSDSDVPVIDSEIPEDACGSVCFTWLPADADSTLRPWEPAHETSETCNGWGLDAPECPDRFTCGGVVTSANGPETSVTRPLCEGAGGPYDLDAELTPRAPDEGLTVWLGFQLSGHPWPEGDAGAAGWLHLEDQINGDRYAIEMPLGATRLELGLDRGVYTTWFTAGERFDPTSFPKVSRRGTLEVVMAGDLVLDIAARTLPLAVTVDGEALAELPADAGPVSIELWGQETGGQTRAFAPGDDLRQPWVLEEDVYDVFVSSPSATGGALPAGEVVMLGALDLTDDALTAVEVSLSTTLAEGAVRIDGEPPPFGASGTAIWRGETGASTELPWTADVDAATYGGRLYTGTYDVLLDTRSAVARGLPDGRVRVEEGIAAGPKNLSATTDTVRGIIRMNLERPDDNVARGFVKHVTEGGGWSDLTIAPTEAATFEGPVFVAPGDLYVDGLGGSLPNGVTRVVEDLALPTEDLSIELAGWPVTFDLNFDGLPNNGDGVNSRGELIFLRIDTATGEPIPDPDPLVDTWDRAWVPLPAGGPLIFATYIEPGIWRGELITNPVAGLPGGRVSLGDIEVVAPVVYSFDLTTTFLSAEIRLDGATAPDARAGDNRGEMQIGLERIALPEVGAARAGALVYEGAPLDITWLCDPGTGCGIAAPATTRLFSGLSP